MSFESLNKSVEILAEANRITMPALDETASETASTAVTDVNQQAVNIQKNIQTTYDSLGVGDPAAEIQTEAQEAIDTAVDATEVAADEAISRAQASIQAVTESVTEVVGPGQALKQLDANAALSEAEAALSNATTAAKGVTGLLNVQSAAANKVAEATQLVDTAKAQVDTLLDNVGLSQLEESASTLVNKADQAAVDLINGLSGGTGGGLSSLNELADPNRLLEQGVSAASEELKGQVQTLIGDAISSVISTVPGLPPILPELPLPVELGDLLPVGLEIPPLTLDTFISVLPGEITAAVDEVAEAKEQIASVGQAITTNLA